MKLDYEVIDGKYKHIFFDLVYVKWKDNRVGHIPAPIVASIGERGKVFLNKLGEGNPRDGKTFYCLKCEVIKGKGKGRSFFKCRCHNPVDMGVAQRKRNILTRITYGLKLPKSIKRLYYMKAVYAQ